MLRYSLIVVIQELRWIIDRPCRPLDLASLVPNRPLGFRREDDLQVLVRRFTIISSQHMSHNSSASLLIAVGIQASCKVVPW